jgi:regulator of sigma E protease
MTILLFAVILIVLIVVHELGHFILAKRAGIRVDEFGLGYPPRIYGWKRGETLYSLNLLPFGGFVRIFGEDYEGQDGNDSSRHFTSKPRYVQAAVLAAGICANALFAWLLISVGYMTGLPSSVGTTLGTVENPELLLVGVLDSSPASEAGLQVGDELISVRTDVDEAVATPEGVSEFIKAHQEQTLLISYERGGEIRETVVMPRVGIVEGQRAIGVSMDMVGMLRLAPHQALVQGARSTWNMLIAIVEGIWSLLRSAFMGEGSLSQVTGPIGIAGMVGDASMLGFAYVLTFTAFISLNLAVINLIPFPALDGGRILFVLVETLRRKTLSPAFARTANVIGFILLLGLMAVVTFNDVLRFF